MIALGIVAAWIAISIVGAKGLLLFARAGASSELEVELDLYRVDVESRFGPSMAYHNVPLHASEIGS
jgi:hypothetical protein